MSSKIHLTSRLVDIAVRASKPSPMFVMFASLCAKLASCGGVLALAWKHLKFSVVSL